MCASRSLLRLVQMLAFRRGGDRPDETDQLSRDGGDDLARGLALGAESHVASTQTQLRLPGDFEQTWVHVALQCALAITQPWLMAIVVRGFDENASEATVSGFGDRAASLISFGAPSIASSIAFSKRARRAP